MLSSSNELDMLNTSENKQITNYWLYVIGAIIKLIKLVNHIKLVLSCYRERA